MTFHCIVGGSRSDRTAVAREGAGSAVAIGAAPPSTAWPFRRDVVPANVPSSSVILIPDLHLAFPTGQKPGTRLVLTQSMYQMQRWLDWLDAHADIDVVAHASREGLARYAPEATARRGPWRRVEFHEIDGDDDAEEDGVDEETQELRAAFTADPAARLATLERVNGRRAGDDPALLLAIASTCVELDDLRPAQDSLERARISAGYWEAVWFEYGKLWLRADDLERAAGMFTEAVRLMPTFSAAWSNLGAALAEVDQPERAIEALEQALRFDPDGHPILANLSVVYREQGRLEEAIAASRRVLEIAPGFVFGYYNLGHALFLRGSFAEARDAYAEGHRRDAQKNPVQAARLALARAAAGDAGSAAQEMRAILERAPADLRERIAGEAQEVVSALVGQAAMEREALQPLAEVVTEFLPGSTP